MDKVKIVADNYFAEDCKANEYIGKIKEAYIAGFKRGVEKQKFADDWHKKSRGIWITDPPSDDVLVTVCDDSGDHPYYYTTTAWYLDGVWISKDDVVCGEVVAWMEFPKPCKEK